MPDITITVKCSNDTKYLVTIDPSKTVLEFKQAIAAKSETPAERQRLIYSGKVLKDADTLETYKIADGQTVHMVKGSAPGGNSSQSSGGQQPRTTPSSNSQSTPQTNTQPNPFAAFGLGQGLGTGGVNPLDAILQNPAMVQMMSQMFRDPQLLESMIAASPQLSGMAPQIRQYMQNPEFQALLSNPETLRQMAAMSSLMGGNFGPFTGGFSDLGGLGLGNTATFTPPTTTPSTQTTETTTTNPTSNTNTTRTSTTTPTSTTFSTTTTASSTGSAAPINPFLNLLNQSAATPGAGTTNPIQPPTNPLLDLWGLGGGTTPLASGNPPVPPEERFQVQLQQLNEMGFWNAQQNIRALMLSGGNVPAAVELLLSGNL
ncbi:6181_t:CDS:2 [Ambispora leptoticha]|uniref:6181_t:CDS:1 n=1 Tax=Ambispora leptoticha TaxID=144679 RepID=A0A9N9FP41_9GLOM|nr:6181_t:CDS:2 [Ambispora leptoticha]